MSMFKALHRLRWLILLAALCGAVAALGMSGLSERGPKRPQRVLSEDPNNARVIVKYRLDSTLRQALSGRGGRPVVAPPQHAAAFAARLGIPVSNGRILGPHTQVLKGKGLPSSQLVARLAAMPEVEWVVVDQRRYISSVPNDPYFGPDQATITPTVGQWYLRAPDTFFLSAINAQAAWDISSGTSSVTVAVLDTGVRFDHPDLASKLYPGYDFIDDTFTANDGAARDGDASDPGDASAAGQCGYFDAQASSWHGTQVAGIVGAATHNGLGMAGVGRDVMVLPIRVLGRCGGYDSDIVAGMRWAAGVSSDVGTSTTVTVVNPHPARVLNLSLGSQGNCSAPYQDVMREMTAHGVAVVVAAGNEEGLEVDTPANCDGAIAVAAVRHLGTKVGFSNLGPEVALAAPGGNCFNLTGPCLYPILTTTNSGTSAPVVADDAYTNSFDISVGTSFAAPQVAGTVGLMLSLNPGLTPAEIRSALRSTARAFPTTGADPEVVACRAPSARVQDECYCTTRTCGAGMLDAAAAVALVFPPPTAVITVDDSALQLSNSVLLSAAASTAEGGRTVAAYQWTIVSGGQYAQFAGRTDAATATLVFVASQGTTEVKLRITDSGGATSNARTTLYAAQGAAVDQPPSVGGGGGGGGSLSVAWAAALLLACAGLWLQAWMGRRYKRD